MQTGTALDFPTGELTSHHMINTCLPTRLQVAALAALVGLAAGPQAGLLGCGWPAALRTLSNLHALQVGSACQKQRNNSPHPSPKAVSRLYACLQGCSRLAALCPLCNLHSFPRAKSRQLLFDLVPSCEPHRLPARVLGGTAHSARLTIDKPRSK